MALHFVHIRSNQLPHLHNWCFGNGEWVRWWDMLKKILCYALLCVFIGAGRACAQSGGTTMQFPTMGWGGFAPARIECGELLGANMNSTADQAIPISFPSAKYVITEIDITNPSVSLTTAAGGFYSAASKGGVAIVSSGQAYSTLTTNAANTTGNEMTATLATAGNTTAFNLSQIYLSLTTAQGAAATADVRVYCRPQM
jgi:hypothetical protein